MATVQHSGFLRSAMRPFGHIIHRCRENNQRQGIPLLGSRPNIARLVVTTITWIMPRSPFSVLKITRRGALSNPIMGQKTETESKRWPTLNFFIEKKYRVDEICRQDGDRPRYAL